MNSQTILNKFEALVKKGVQTASPIVKKEIAKSVSKSASDTVSLVIKLGCAGLAIYAICSSGSSSRKLISSIPEEEVARAINFTYNEIHSTINYILKGDK